MDHPDSRKGMRESGVVLARNSAHHGIEARSYRGGWSEEFVRLFRVLLVRFPRPSLLPVRMLAKSSSGFSLARSANLRCVWRSAQPAERRGNAQSKAGLGVIAERSA